MNDHACTTCQDTGITQSGFLDCPFCDAPAKRTEFNRRLEAKGLLPRSALHLDTAWEAYRMGLADARADRQ